MVLKYQVEIEKRTFKGISCPMDSEKPDNLISYRFVNDPIDHELNFLPNIAFDRKKGIKFDYEKAEDEKYCSRCGGSFYDELSNAKKAWKGLPPRIRENLGYTHVAEGLLVDGDGVMGEIRKKDGHFLFYESEGADLKKKFQIKESL